MTRRIDAPKCKAPGQDGHECGRPSRYSTMLVGHAEKVPLCDAHNMQIHRAYKAGKELLLRPLQEREVKRKTLPCTGPAPHGKQCALPGWNLGPDGQRLCDAHKKQWKRRGVLWPIGEEAPK